MQFVGMGCKMQFNTINKKWWALVGISLACFVGFIDFAIVNTALPAIQKDLSASILQLQWMINSFGLTLCVLMASMGRLADIYGRRWLNNIGLIIFGLSSLFAGLSDNAWLLIFFRACQGFSLAFIVPCSLALISHTFPEEQRGRAMGIWGSIGGLGLALGPVIGGFITHWWSWHWIFFINVPVIVISFIICGFSVQESKDEQPGKVDSLGILTFTIALTALIVAVMQGADWGWNSPAIIVLFIVSVVTFILFYKVEQRHPSPLIKFQLFKNPIFFSCVLSAFTLMFFVWPAFFFAPLFLHNIRLESMGMVGLMLLPITGAVAIFSSVVGVINDKVGSKILIVIGLTLVLLAALLQAFFQVQTPTMVLLLSFFIMGLAWAFVAGPKTNAALAALPASASGIASGILWTIQDTGGAVGLAIAGAIFHHQEKVDLLRHIRDEKLVTQLLKNSSIAQPDAMSFVSQAFMRGFHSVMFLFSAFTFISLCLVTWMFYLHTRFSNIKPHSPT